MAAKVDVLTRKLIQLLGYLSSAQLSKLDTQRGSSSLEKFILERGLIPLEQMEIVREVRWEWLVGKQAVGQGWLDMQELQAYIREKINRLRRGERPGILLLKREVLSKAQLLEITKELLDKKLITSQEYEYCMQLLHQIPLPQSSGGQTIDCSALEAGSDPAEGQTDAFHINSKLAIGGNSGTNTSISKHSYALSSLALPASCEKASPNAPIIIEDLETVLAPGHCIRHYQIIEKIGGGGMGEVYKAYHPVLDKEVAIKVIRHGRTGTEEEIARFQQEARLTAKLDHSNIVRVYDVDQEAHFHYIVMDYIKGVPIDQYFNLRGQALKRRRSSGRVAVKIVAPPDLLREKLAMVEKLCLAIHYAHRQGIIHRDLKPENILVDEHGTPFIMDFGLAKNIKEDSRTKTGQIMGTPRYMAPEQACGRSDLIGKRTDVYALGAVLYVLLTGKPVVEGQNTMSILYNVCNEDPIPPREYNPEIPHDVESICLKALQKKPYHRYASARRMAEDIRRFLNDEVVLAEAPTMIYKIGKVSQRVKKQRNLAVICALLLPLAVVVLLVIAVLHKPVLQQHATIAYKDKGPTTASKQPHTTSANLPPNDSGRTSSVAQSSNRDSSGDSYQHLRQDPQTGNNHKSEQAAPTRPDPQAKQAAPMRSDPQAGPDPQTRPEPQTRPDPPIRPAPQGGPDPQTKPAPQTRPDPQTKPTPQGGPGPRMKPAPQTRPDPPSGHNVVKNNMLEVPAHRQPPSAATSQSQHRASSVHNSQRVVDAQAKPNHQHPITSPTKIAMLVEEFKDLGNSYFLYKQYAQAIIYYQKWAQLDARLHPKVAEQDGMPYFNLGIIYTVRDTKFYAPEKAFFYYSQALKRLLNFRTKAKIYLNRAYLYRKQKQYQKALQEYSHALQYNPRYADAYFSRGVIYQLLAAQYKGIDPLKIQQYYNLAVQEYRTAIRYDPIYWEAYFNRAVVYQMQGKYRLALQDYQKTLQIKPNHRIARKYLVDLKKRLHLK